MKSLLPWLGALLLGGGALAFAQDGAKPVAAQGDDAVIAQQLPSYPLTTCPISGKPLPKEAKNVVHEGRLVRFCCEQCPAAFEKEPAATLKKIDDAVVAAQKASYPLTTCVVSDEELGGMGEPVEYVHGTRLVRFCCKSCIKGFKKDSAAGMKKIDDALIAAQKASYPMAECVISGEALGDGSADFLYGTRLVRFCCKDCIKEFQKDPSAHLAKLDAAAKGMKKG